MCKNMPDLEENPTQYIYYVIKFRPDYLQDERINIGLYLLYRNSKDVDVHDGDEYETWNGTARLREDYMERIVEVFGKTLNKYTQKDLDYFSEFIKAEFDVMVDEEYINITIDQGLSFDASSKLTNSSGGFGLENKSPEIIFENIWKRYFE